METQPPAPVDPYGIAKFAVELDLAQASEQFGLHYSIVRPQNVVGVYQNIWDRYRNVVGIWCRQIISGQAVTIYGTGEQRRAFSSIEFYMDPLETLLTCQASNGQIFNMGADKDYKILDVAHIVCGYAKKKGFSPVLVFLEERKEVKVAFCNHTKAKTVLGFQDKTDMETLVQQLFDWAETQPVRLVKTMQYELTNNLYSYWL